MSAVRVWVFRYHLLFFFICLFFSLLTVFFSLFFARTLPLLQFGWNTPLVFIAPLRIFSFFCPSNISSRKTLSFTRSVWDERNRKKKAFSTLPCCWRTAVFLTGIFFLLFFSSRHLKRKVVCVVKVSTS